jgi:ribonuclease P protein component
MELSGARSKLIREADAFARRRRNIMNMSDPSFPPEHRLHRTAEYDQVFARRASAADSWLVVYGRENGLSHSRLGLVVSAKVGGAVVRNRWKRLLREAFRLERETLPAGIDLVVVPRPIGPAPQLAALRSSLETLAGKVARKLKRKKP